jgi:hypothetical protein
MSVAAGEAPAAHGAVCGNDGRGKRARGASSSTCPSSFPLRLHEEGLQSVAEFLGFESVRTLGLLCSRMPAAVCAQVRAFRRPAAGSCGGLPVDMLGRVVSSRGLVSLDLCEAIDLPGHPERVVSWAREGLLRDLQSLRIHRSYQTELLLCLQEGFLPGLQCLQLVEATAADGPRIAEAVVKCCPAVRRMDTVLLQCLALDQLTDLAKRGVADASFVLANRCSQVAEPHSAQLKIAREWMCTAASQGHELGALSLSYMSMASHDWLEAALWLLVCVTQHPCADEAEWLRQCDTLSWNMGQAILGGSASAIAIGCSSSEDSLASALKLASFEGSLAAKFLLRPCRCTQLKAASSLLCEEMECNGALGRTVEIATRGLVLRSWSLKQPAERNRPATQK